MFVCRNIAQTFPISTPSSSVPEPTKVEASMPLSADAPEWIAWT
jgi:hypothetical protein